MEHSPGRSGTVDKALDLLLHLHAADSARGLTEIARSLELPKSTAHRLLQALVRRGLVEQADRGRYQPGIALVALGLGVLDREPVVLAARPILETQARELGHTLFLATARAGRILVLDKEEGLGFRLARMPIVGRLMHFVTPRSVIEKTLQAAFADPALVTDAMVTRYHELLLREGSREASAARFRLPV